MGAVSCKYNMFNSSRNYSAVYTSLVSDHHLTSESRSGGSTTDELVINIDLDDTCPADKWSAGKQQTLESERASKLGRRNAICEELEKHLSSVADGKMTLRKRRKELIQRNRLEDLGLLSPGTSKSRNRRTGSL